jgi:hypothetical protein
MPVLLLWAVPAVILLAALVVFLCARCIDSPALQERSGDRRAFRFELRRRV